MKRPVLSIGLALLALSQVCAPGAHATHLTSAVYVAKATKDIAAGTILSPSNISIGATHESDQIPSGAMWLTAPDEAYGFKIHRACAKEGAITGYDLIESNQNDLSILKADPLWKQYTKSSIVCDKRHDFVASHRYEEGAVAELEKLAKGKQHLTFMDDEMLIFSMTHHIEESSATAKSSGDNLRRQLANLSSPAVFMNLDELKAQQAKVQSDRLAKANSQAAKDKRLYTVLSAVLPPKCQIVRLLAEGLKTDASMAKILEPRTVPVKSREMSEIEAHSQKMQKHVLAQSSSDQAKLSCAKGQMQLFTADYKQAVSSFDEAIKADADCAQAYDGRGYARAKLAEYGGAVEDFNHLLKIVANDPIAHFNRGVALCYQEKYKSAADDFSEVVKVDASDTVALFDRAFARNKASDSGATADLDKALTMPAYITCVPVGRRRLCLNPDQVYAFLNPRLNQQSKSEQAAGETAHVALGDREAGAEDNRLGDKMMKANMKFSQLEAQSSQKGTIDNYNQLLKLRPTYAYAYYGRGQGRKDLGDYKGAVEDFTLSLKYNANNGHAYQCRGDAREQLGDKKGADEDHQQAAKIEPMYKMTGAMKTSLDAMKNILKR